MKEVDFLHMFPNLKAIVDGTIAGNFRDWPAVRQELISLVDLANQYRFDALMEKEGK